MYSAGAHPKRVGSALRRARLDYAVVGTQRQVGYQDGRWQDVVILQLILEDVPAEILPTVPYRSSNDTPGGTPSPASGRRSR